MITPSVNNHVPGNRPRRFKWLAGLISLMLICVLLAGYWLVNSQSGLQWTFSIVYRLSSGAIHFAGVQGTLHDLRIENIHFVDDEFKLEGQNIRIVWNPGKLFYKQIAIDQLTAETLKIHHLASEEDTPRGTLPESLNLPLALSIHALTIDSMYMATAENKSAELIITNLVLALESDGHMHQLKSLNFHTPWGSVTASAEFKGSSPFDLSAQIDLSGVDPWGDAQMLITGSLERMKIQASTVQSTIAGDLHLQLHPFADNPVVRLNANIEQLNPANLIAAAPQASLSLSAYFAQNDSGQLEGKMRIENHAAAPYNVGGLPVSTFSTRALITSKSLGLQDIYVKLESDGLLRGNLIWRWDEQSASADLLVERLNPYHIDRRLQAAQVSGKIQWSGNVQTQSARIHLKDKSVDLTAVIARSGENVVLEQLNLQRNKSHFAGHGRLALEHPQAFELSGQLENFNIADFVRTVDSNLNAVLHLSGQLSPQVSGALTYTIQNSRLAKSPVSGSGEIAFNGFNTFDGKAELKAGSNQLVVQGSMGGTGNIFHLRLKAPDLAQLGFGLAGDLQANVNLAGSFEAPSLDLKLASTRLHLPNNQSMSGVSVDTALHNDTITLKVSTDHYDAHEKMTLKNLTVVTQGKISDHVLSVKAQINEDITFRLAAAGGVNPKKPLQSLRWTGQFTEIATTGKMPVRLLSPAAFSVSAQSVSLDQARFSISGGFANLDQWHWTSKDWKTQGNFSGITLFPGSQPASHQSHLQSGGHWDFVSNQQLLGNLKIFQERGDWYLPGDVPQPLGIEKLQLRATAEHGKLIGEFKLLSQLIGFATANLTIPLRKSGSSWSISPESPLLGKADVDINTFNWLNVLLDGNMRIEGQIQARADIQGTLQKPDFSGTVSGSQLRVAVLDQGINLQQGTLTAKFRQTDLEIDRLHFITPHEVPPDKRLFSDFKAGGMPGSLTITGNVGLAGNESRMNFIINQLPLGQKAEYWVMVSGSGETRLQHNHLSVKGDLSADAGLLLQPPEGRPELSEDIVFVNAPEQAGHNLSVLLDMRLNLGEKFYIQVAGLEGRLTGQLQVQSDKNNKLKLNGTIAAQDTSFKAYGQDLSVKRGIVSFQGPLDDPELNILALRENLAVEAGVEIMGSVRHPRVKLISTPDVPDTEKLSWIVLGRKPDASGLDTSVLLSAAGSILGGQSGGGVTEQISAALGVDEISFRQAGVGSSLSGQIGVVGKRLSSRAYLSYERGLTATTMGITKLTYNLTPKITVVTQAGEDSAADLFYTIQFD